jgi:hypothetical protein
MTVLEHLKHRTDLRIALWWVLILILWVGTLLVLGAPTTAQELHDHDLRGPHPAVGAPDPYASTTADHGQVNCCHGQDCARFYGEPKRANRDGVQGWMFGQWFIRNDQIIDVDTLPISERGYHHLCINKLLGPLCGYVAMGA